MASSARIDELQKKFNENPRRYFAPLADEYRKAGDLQAAIELCRTHLAQQPGHMSGHIVLGKALYEGGELDEARQTFETALGLDPENLIALRHLGDIARQQGDAYGARQWYQRVLDADPRNEEIAAQIQALDEMPATQAFGGASSAPAMIEPELTPELAAAPDTLAESTVVDGTLPPALEPSAIAYLAEEPTLEVPAYRASAGTQEPIDLDVAGLDFDAPAAPPAEPPRAPSRVEAASGNALGLESMEFVAPSREERGARAEGLERPEYDFDPQVVDGEVRNEATPAAFVTETMAELYLQQGFTDEALQVYRQLLEANPRDENLRARVQQLEGGGRSTLAFGVSEEVVRAAQERHARANRPTARRFFASLAARRAPARDAQGQDGTQAWAATSIDADHADAAPADAAPADPYGYDATGVDTSAMDAGTLIDAPDAQSYDTQAYDAEPSDTHAHGADEQHAQGYSQSGYEHTGYQQPQGADGALDGSLFGDSQFGEVEADTARMDETRTYEAQSFATQGWDAPAGGTSESEPAAHDGYDPASGTWSVGGDDSAASGTGEYDVAAFERGSWDAASPPSSTPAAGSSSTGATGTGAGANNGTSGAGGTVDALFGGASGTAADEAAASALAGAFAGTPAAIPAVRPATGELSLDQVFRETPRRSESQRRESSGFSFDQFFSESQGGQNPAPPAQQPGAAGASGTPGEGGENDEQFNAWLEGLKQK